MDAESIMVVLAGMFLLSALFYLAWRLIKTLRSASITTTSDLFMTVLCGMYILGYYLWLFDTVPALFWLTMAGIIMWVCLLLSYGFVRGGLKKVFFGKGV